MSFKIYDKRGNGILNEREFIEMTLKCYQAGHTLLKIEMKRKQAQVDRLDQKILYLKNSQQNKFKNTMVTEFNKYRFNLQVSLSIKSIELIKIVTDSERDVVLSIEIWFIHFVKL